MLNQLGLQSLQGRPMDRLTHFTTILIISLGLFLTSSYSQELVLPDTVIFKSGVTPPGGIRGAEVRCSIISESETSVRIDRSTSRGIADMVEIPREMIAEIKRADIGERRFQELKSSFKMPENSQEASYYSQLLEEELEPFLSKFEASQYVPEVQKMIDQVKAELEKVYQGQVRRGDRWMMSQEWKDLQREYEPLDLFREIEVARGEQDIGKILDLTKKITTDHPSIHFPSTVDKTAQLLTDLVNGMTVDTFVNKIKDQLVGVEGKLDTQNALLLQEKNKAERRAIQGRIKGLTAQKTQLTGQISQTQKNYNDLEKKVNTEIDRLRKIDMSKKNEALKVLEGAEKLRGNAEATDLFIEQIQKAAKLWSGCTGVWSVALSEVSDRIDAASKALQENRLIDSEVEMKNAFKILNAAGNVPAGVASLKKWLGDNLKAFGSARILTDDIQKRDWDKVPDRILNAEKSFSAPKPLDYPVSHRFAKAYEAWIKGQQKIMADTMSESDAFVAQFYNEVKTVGFIAASEYLLKAKDLWENNPKIAAANAEFKGELERIEREKKMEKLKPLSYEVERALKDRKPKDAEAAIKKLENAFAAHPSLEKMKFDLKDLKDKLALEDKAKQEATEAARLEEERKEKQKTLITYGVIALLALVGGTVGLTMWMKKKKKEQEEVIFTNDDNSSPPTVS